MRSEETVRQRKRDRLQPEIRVGVSGSQVFSLFAARTWNRTWLQLLSFSVVLPLSPACLPGCLLWLSHCPVRLCSVIRCAAYLSKPSRITLQQRRLPFHTQWPVSSLPVPTAVSSTNPSSPTIHCQTLCLFSSFCRGRSVNCQLGVQFRLAYTFLQGLWGLLRSNQLNWNELGTEVDCYYLAYPFCIIWDCISLLTITAIQSICYSYNSPLRLPTYIWTYNFCFSCMHFAHISKLVHWQENQVGHMHEVRTIDRSTSLWNWRHSRWGCRLARLINLRSILPYAKMRQVI